MLLSISLIVKNEAKHLAKCLTALQPLLRAVDSELIITDTGSTDGTIAIARQFTDNILQIEWRDDFAWARNQGLQVARGEWFMFLDADEVLEDAAELIRFFKNGVYKRYGHARYGISNTREGKVTTKAYIPRLFKRTPHVCFTGAIHESFANFEDPGGVLKLTNFLHDGYDTTDDYAKWEAKNLRNYDLVVSAYREHPDNNDKLMHLINQLYSICSGEETFQTTLIKDLDAKKELFHYLDIGLQIDRTATEFSEIQYVVFVERYADTIMLAKGDNGRLIQLLTDYLTGGYPQYTNYVKLCFVLAQQHTANDDHLKAMEWYETGIAVWEQHDKQPFLSEDIGSLLNSMTYDREGMSIFYTTRDLTCLNALQEMKDSESPVDTLLDYVFEHDFLQGNTNTTWTYSISQMLFNHMLEGVYDQATNEDLFNAFILVRSEYLRCTTKLEEKELLINRFVVAVEKAYELTGYPLVKALKKTLNILPAFEFVVSPMVHKLEQTLATQ